jgi:hypothetical protein
MDTWLFRVRNKQSAASGTPPEIDAEIRSRTAAELAM